MTNPPRQIRAAQGGFNLIELMVALMLGLLVIGAAGSLFLSNQRVYGSTESLNRIQENQRSAFEMMARDIREAGTNPCLRFSATVEPIQQLVSPDTAFWAAFRDSIRGTATEVTLYSAGTTHTVSAHKVPANVITVTPATATLANGQPLLICNADMGITFSPSGITSAGTTIAHDSAANCGKGLTATPDATKCTLASSGPGYCFWLGAAPTATDVTNCPGGIGQSPAYVVVPVAARWFRAANTRGGNSLYRSTTVPGGTTVTNEIAEGVTNLQLTYKVGNAAAYVAAGSVTDWSAVTAIRLQMTFQAVRGALSQTQVRGTDGNALSRTLDDYIVLRNHQDIQ